MIATKEKRNKRAKVTAEVFSPPFLVNAILDKLPPEVWEPDKTFIDPAAGNGNMLIHVLYRKIAVYDHDPLEALRSIYGVDIMRDNIRECRIRLLKVVSLFEDIIEEHLEAVFPNIVWLNLKKYPKGSLEYDFSFKKKHKQADIERWMEWINECNLLDEVRLPVSSGGNQGGVRLQNHDMFPSEGEE